MNNPLNPETARYTLIIRNSNGSGEIERKEFARTFEGIEAKHEEYLKYDKYHFARKPGKNITINPTKKSERERNA